MPSTVTELITNAYYASGLVAREFETVSGAQVTDGLKWLNDILSEKTVDDGMVPYETTANFIAIAGQEKYTIPNLIKIDTLTFEKDTVRYSMRYEKRNQYFGNTRVNGINSLPFEWYFERQLGGGDLYIYFTPDLTYPFEIHGIFRMGLVALGDDLELTLDRFYTTYLRYALAERICSEDGYDVPKFVIKQLGKYEAFIDKRSRLMDLRMKKSSTLQKQGGINWGLANLWRGFFPG